MRKHVLLSELEREQLLGIPTERDEIVRLYTFEQRDIDLIVERKGDANRLGVALQLALLRHPGVAMAQFLDRKQTLPAELVAYVVEQLDIPADVFPIMPVAHRQ